MRKRVSLARALVLEPDITHVRPNRQPGSITLATRNVDEMILDDLRAV